MAIGQSPELRCDAAAVLSFGLHKAGPTTMGPKAAVCRHWYATEEHAWGTYCTRATAAPRGTGTQQSQPGIGNSGYSPRLDQDNPPPKIASSVPLPAPDVVQSSGLPVRLQSGWLFTESTEIINYGPLKILYSVRT